MDKKKVKELIEKAIGVNLNNLVIGDNEYNAPINKTNALLNEAIKELSKSDWISVEDGLPEFGKIVNVCNKYDVDDVWSTFRTQEYLIDKDNLGFAFRYGHMNITHWQPIEKLEE